MDCAAAPSSIHVEPDHMPSLPLPSRGVPTLMRGRSQMLPFMSPVTPGPCEEQKPDTCNEEEGTALMLLAKAAARQARRDGRLLEDILRNNGTSYLKCRHVIVEWLVDVSRLFHCGQATTHIAVYYMDLCMALRTINERSWQLCAAASLLVAAKCEEAADMIPRIKDLAYFCGNEYSADLIRQMEVIILDLLDWDPIIRAPLHFLRLFQRVTSRCERERVPKRNSSFLWDNEDYQSFLSPQGAGGGAGVKLGTLDDAKGRGHVGLTPRSSASGLDCSPIARGRRVRRDTRFRSRDANYAGLSPASTNARHNRRATFLDNSYDPCRTDTPVEGCRGFADVCSDESDLEEESDIGDFTADMDTDNPSRSVDDEVFLTAQFVLDLTLYEPRIKAKYKPQVLAASAWAVGRKVGAVHPTWTDSMASITGLEWDPEVVHCFHELLALFEQARD